MRPRRLEITLLEVVEEGEMPPGYYKLMHAGANLTEEQRDQLIAGFRATFGSGEFGGEGGESDESHESGESDND